MSSRQRPGLDKTCFQFCRDSHTLMIFDRGSFVEGERWIDGARLTTSGPLDIGLDVVPAHSEFHALAGPGSNVGCTVISIVGDAFAEATGTTLRSASCLRPSVGLENDLLSLLTARVRQVSRAETVATHDRLYLESICMVLFREVLLAQEQDHAASPQRPTGGLSARAQRIIRDFLHDHDHDDLHQRVGLQALADLVGVSRFHFTRAFKVSFGVSP
jgi:AraC family transcriptional regulator